MSKSSAKTARRTPLPLTPLQTVACCSPLLAEPMSTEQAEQVAALPKTQQGGTIVNEVTTGSAELREQVREHYAGAALTVLNNQGAACCGTPVDEAAAALYDPAEQSELPAEAVLASLGCGNPTAVADLREGERVLDLGSGGGIDVLLSAKRVGPTGFVWGVDMTPEMLQLARANATKAGVPNVEFLEGTIEAIPLPAESVDVVISNCVINLSVDKPAVFAEMHRVLRPGGRLGISDIVADDDLSPQQRAELGSYAGCIAGALSRSEYLRMLGAAGFHDASVTITHDVADGMRSAIIHATK
jgi:SAM-dependent methyltransferase